MTIAVAFAAFLFCVALGIIGTCILLRRSDDRPRKDWPNVGPY